jgi:acyl dehydratase
MPIPNYTMTTAPQFVGRELGVSNWVSVDQDRIDQFAACTGDRQWIHVDVERAKRESPFGGPVAHGYLTLSLVAAMVTELRAWLASAEPQSGGRMLLTLQGTLEIEGEAKPALVAELLCMLIGKSDASS